MNWERMNEMCYLIGPLLTRLSESYVVDFTPIHHGEEASPSGISCRTKDFDHRIFAGFAFNVGNKAVTVQDPHGRSHSSRSLAFSSIRALRSFPFVPVIPAILRM